MNSNIAIIALTAKGSELAHNIKAILPNSEVHGKQGRVVEFDQSFTQTKSHLQALFNSQTSIIGICASGILFRTLAGVVGNKHEDPPVIAVSEDGQFVIPLLGGHHGANELSQKIADHFQTHAAITTTSDSRFCVALDNPPAGWQLTNHEHYKDFMAGILAGNRIHIDPVLSWIDAEKFDHDDDSKHQCVSSIFNDVDNQTTLVYAPKSVVIGVGCERNTTAEEVISLIKTTLKKSNVATQSIAALVSVDLKMDETAIIKAAEYFSLPLRFFDVDTLDSTTDRLANPSDVVFKEIGCHGVAEASALVMTGESGNLIVEKQKSKRATCAIACSNNPITLNENDKAITRGHLSVVSLGPGSQQWRSPQATQALMSSTHWVGYSFYLDLAKDCDQGQIRHDFNLGEEKLRVEKALDLASEGKQVALICSGDAGIYAMGALVYECLDQIDSNHRWQKPQITMLPGISALQAAAARSGAILGHDFAVISLSDLLTPWEYIAKRLEAASQGDFVVAFYNPVSRRRTTQLAYAKQTLLKYRSADTPVIIARQLGRDEEHITILTLGELEVEQVDMLSIVLIGSSTSRKITLRSGKHWVYTPRGYDKKQN